MARSRAKADPFEDLTWDDLNEWAGPTIVSRGRGYQRGGQVRNLARTPTGGAAAWVYGTRKYATQVERVKGKLSSACTCPYWTTCKHAVAVVLEYLEHRKHDKEIPAATEQDRRLALLQEHEEASPWDEEDDAGWSEDEWAEEDDDLADHEARGRRAARFTPRRATKAATDTLSSFLERQTKEQLVAFVREQAKRHPAIRQALQDRSNLSAGAVHELVRAVQEEVDELGGEPDWDEDWDRTGSLGDYARVRDRLEMLLASGHAGEVIALGEKLLRAGTRRVEMTDDEGETADALASCMDVVFRALPHSALSPAEQMLWAIDADLDDAYDLCRGAESFWQRKHAAADWNIVADKLARRLQQYRPAKGEDAFSRNYQRDRLSGWLIEALENAGRHEEIIPLCEREAEETGSYLRLVARLAEDGRREEAERWIHKGIKATQRQWPGIADQLRVAMREMREKKKDWPSVAAFYAEDFFRQPSLQTFQALHKAADRAGVWPAVRAAAMRYLETGELPQKAKARGVPPWPLPETGLPAGGERYKQPAPMVNTLIEIAIAEKKPDEVIRWYDRRKPQKLGWGYDWFSENKIAEAIADAYPDRAVAIWKTLAGAQIALTDTKAYEAAASYLRKVHRILKKMGRGQEWKDYLSKLREANIRKRRLMEILDSLENRRILG
ncbi:MAG: hypothetical protein AB1671_05050 [Thermodesulfobacteriota bacterium]